MLVTFTPIKQIDSKQLTVALEEAERRLSQYRVRFG